MNDPGVITGVFSCTEVKTKKQETRIKISKSGRLKSGDRNKKIQNLKFKIQKGNLEKTGKLLFN